jgi:hypothetical protein
MLHRPQASEIVRYFYLARARWVALTQALDLLSTELAREARFCTRTPSRLATDVRHAPHAARLLRCRAFGQHLQRLPQARQAAGQYGLYGTASGLELLAHTPEARAFLRQDADALPEQAEWLRTFLSGWSFLDLTLSTLGDIEGGQFWYQTRTTLRVCQVLRTIAEISELLQTLQNPSLATDSDCPHDLYADVSPSLCRDALVRHTGRLLAVLRAAKSPGTIRSGAYRVPDSADHSCLCFAPGIQAVPTDRREWLFLWSSAIVALVRAYRANLLTASEVVSVVGNDAMRSIVSVATSSDSDDDAPFRLFGLWAVAHLPPLTMNEGPDATEFPLHLEAQEAATVKQEIARVCGLLLGAPTALVDVHSPYQIVFSDGTHADHYHGDYFVIPVAPLVLSLVSVHLGHWLYRPSVSRLLVGWLDTADKRDDGDTLRPFFYQVGAFNALVNSVYYREAIALAERSLGASQSRAARYAAAGILRDNSRSLATAAVVLTLLVMGRIVPSTSLFITIVFGIVCSLVAAFVYPYLTVYFRGRR